LTAAGEFTNSWVIPTGKPQPSRAGPRIISWISVARQVWRQVVFGEVLFEAVEISVTVSLLISSWNWGNDDFLLGTGGVGGS